MSKRGFSHFMLRDGTSLQLPPGMPTFLVKRADEVLQRGPEHGWDLRLLIQLAYLQGFADAREATDAIPKEGA